MQESFFESGKFTKAANVADEMVWSPTDVLVDLQAEFYRYGFKCRFRHFWMLFGLLMGCFLGLIIWNGWIIMMTGKDIVDPSFIDWRLDKGEAEMEVERRPQRS